jgi:adenosine deaminase
MAAPPVTAEQPQGPALRARPKVELHLHLEGAAPPALTRRLAAGRGVDIADLVDAGGGYVWQDFGSFLACYDRVTALYDTPEAQAALAEAALRSAAAQGVIYAELTLSPDHVGGDAVAWSEHLAAVTEGAAKARQVTGIEARAIATGVRHFGPDSVERAARLAIEVMHPFVVGFGLAGDERVGALADFRHSFDAVREAGLGITVHAGEFGGPENVTAALDTLGARRIGHGVRAAEDPALLARLAAEGVVLEVCPGSNLALGLYRDMTDHPIRRLVEAGCRVTLNTDDPPFFHTSMTREYALAAGALGPDHPAIDGFARTALAAAFCDDTLRARLAARL